MISIDVKAPLSHGRQSAAIEMRRHHRGSFRGWIARIRSIRPRAPFVSVAAFFSLPPSPLSLPCRSYKSSGLAAPRRRGRTVYFFGNLPSISDNRSSPADAREKGIARIPDRIPLPPFATDASSFQRCARSRPLLNTPPWRFAGRNNIDPLKFSSSARVRNCKRNYSDDEVGARSENFEATR